MAENIIKTFILDFVADIQGAKYENCAMPIDRFVFR